MISVIGISRPTSDLAHLAPNSQSSLVAISLFRRANVNSSEGNDTVNFTEPSLQ